MKTYEFTIVASGLNLMPDDFDTCFYDAGCDDATISFQKGHIIIDFAREASDVCEAYASAVEAVLVWGATVDRIEPAPLVSLSDIAARSGLTRAAMKQYSKGQRKIGYPNPVAKVTSMSPLWEWSAVSKWLFAQKRVDRKVVVEAEAVRVANSIITHHGSFRDELCREVKEFEDALC